MMEGRDRVVIRDCPCGQAHACDAALWAAFLRTVADLPATVAVVTRWGTWAVPRQWIALHGLAAGTVPTLAMRYGWARVEPEES